MTLNVWQILIVVCVVLLLFGRKPLASAGRGVVDFVKGFRKVKKSMRKND
jgi:TatA/E family protein of Tat protein translocase